MIDRIRRMSASQRVVMCAATALALLSGTDPTRAARADEPFDVFEKSINDLQAAMTDGRVTSETLVGLYLQRIRAFDRDGPRLNAVLYLNPNASRDARALDAERKRNGRRGPLHGIPVLLKDNFDTKDMPTTGGSLALAGVVPADDAFQVRKLRQAGVVILGKVNLHELALGLTTVSSLGGQTLDPYDITRAPGGSSGGSGVAAAASFAAFTLGTDTSGSIRIPSAHNSVVGLRPTAGLSSRTGIIPFGHTQDTGGPIARSVRDIAIVLDATVGYDPADPITSLSKDRIPATYTSSLRVDALGGARIGVLRELFGDAPGDAPVGDVVRTAIGELAAGGANVIDVVIPNLQQQLMASSLLSQELKFDLRDYLSHSRRARIKSLEDLLASGLHTAQFQGFVETANAMPDDYPAGADYAARRAAREALGGVVIAAMDAGKVDALVYPTTRRIAPLVGGTQAGSNAALSAQTGFPAITVPAGFTSDGFPVGIEMLGRPFAEPTLLALAYAYESATHHRRPPETAQPLTSKVRERTRNTASSDTGPGSVAFDVAASGSRSVPPSRTNIASTVRFTFNPSARRLGYAVLSIEGDRIGGMYLHRRANRPNGGVAYILTKSAVRGSAGVVTLTESEAADLKAGKLYIAVLDATDPFVSARGDLVLP